MVSRKESGGVTQEWVFRHCAEAHKNLIETVKHATTQEGRYHPAGEFGAIYVACDQETTLRELDHRAKKAGVSRTELLPRLLLTLHLRVQKTDEDTREAWGATLEEITDEDDYSRCHEIARLALRDGYEAIRFPTFDGKGENYAIFYDRLKPGSELAIQHEGWISEV